MLPDTEAPTTVHQPAPGSAEAHALWQQAACGTVSFQAVFLRADEWLGDPPLWQALAAPNRALRHGLSTVNSR